MTCRSIACSGSVCVASETERTRRRTRSLCGARCVQEPQENIKGGPSICGCKEVAGHQAEEKRTAG